jgi:large subunit ribosomal protein L22
MYQAVLKNVRISPRKMRLVADLVRGKQVQLAMDTLQLTNKKGARIMSKILKSAISNASDVATIDVDRLQIAEVTVDMGPALRRFIPRAQGRATPVKKRMSHVTLRVKEV